MILFFISLAIFGLLSSLVFLIYAMVTKIPVVLPVLLFGGMLLFGGGLFVTESLGVWDIQQLKKTTLTQDTPVRTVPSPTPTPTLVPATPPVEGTKKPEPATTAFPETAFSSPKTPSTTWRSGIDPDSIKINDQKAVYEVISSSHGNTYVITTVEPRENPDPFLAMLDERMNKLDEYTEEMNQHLKSKKEIPANNQYKYDQWWKTYNKLYDKNIALLDEFIDYPLEKVSEKHKEYYNIYRDFWIERKTILMLYDQGTKYNNAAQLIEAMKMNNTLSERTNKKIREYHEAQREKAQQNTTQD